MKHPSGSGAETFARCPASAVLPQTESYEAKTENGTDGHALISDLIAKKPGASDAIGKAIPGLGFKLEEILAGVEARQAEGAYVVNVKKKTSTFLGVDIGRDYAGKLGRPLEMYEMGVSLDLAGSKGKTFYIRDWKFGIYHSWWQLYVQAMAIMWSGSGPTEIDAGFVFIEDRDREGDDGLYVREEAVTLYEMDLDERADELAVAFDLAKRMGVQLEKSGPSSLKTVQGSWCQYCGAFPHCPSKWALAKSMLGLDVVGHVEALTPEQCGLAWKKLAEIEKNIVKKTKDALKERMLTEGGFPLENGKRLKMVEMPGRDSLDRPAVVALLREKGATQAEINGLFRQGQPYSQVKEVRS